MSITSPLLNTQDFIILTTKMIPCQTGAQHKKSTWPVSVALAQFPSGVHEESLTGIFIWLLNFDST